MSSTVELKNGHLSVGIDAALGGSIVWCDSSSTGPVLRSARERGDRVITDTASFPMVPFCNRIRNRELRWNNTEYELDANTTDGRTTAHGFGWHSAWKIDYLETDAITLLNRHEAGHHGWPWTYEASQTITVQKNKLVSSLTVTNCSPQPMPVGLGFHPYFPAAGDARMAIFSSEVFTVDPTGFPTLPSISPKNNSGSSMIVMSTITGNRYIKIQKPEIELEAPEWHHNIKLTFSANCTNVAIHIEKGNKCFCVEPMTHFVGAFDNPRTVPTIENGNTYRTDLIIEVTQKRAL